MIVPCDNKLFCICVIIVFDKYRSVETDEVFDVTMCQVFCNFDVESEK